MRPCGSRQGRRQPFRRRTARWRCRPRLVSRPTGARQRSFAWRQRAAWPSSSFSLRGIDLARMNGLGLLSVLPAGAIAGVILVALAFVLGLALPKAHPVGLGAVLVSRGGLPGRGHSLHRAPASLPDHVSDPRIRRLRQQDRAYRPRPGGILQLARFLRVHFLCDGGGGDPQHSDPVEDMADAHRLALSATALPHHAQPTLPMASAMAGGVLVHRRQLGRSGLLLAAIVRLPALPRFRGDPGQLVHRPGRSRPLACGAGVTASPLAPTHLRDRPAR